MKVNVELLRPVRSGVDRRAESFARRVADRAGALAAERAWRRQGSLVDAGGERDSDGEDG